MTALRHHGHELLKLAKALLRQHPVLFGIEQTGGGLAHRRRAIRSGAKMHAAFAFIAQIQLGKCRLVAARKRRPGAALFLQPRQREFDVLASTQFAGGIIGAGTEIAARPQAPNRHAIAGLRNGIADPKLGEKRFAAQIFKPEGLLAAELTAQAALPVQRRQIRARMGARKLGFLVRLGRGIQVSVHQRPIPFSKVSHGTLVLHPMLLLSAGAPSIFAKTPGDQCPRTDDRHIARFHERPIGSVAKPGAS